MPPVVYYGFSFQPITDAFADGVSAHRKPSPLLIGRPTRTTQGSCQGARREGYFNGRRLHYKTQNVRIIPYVWTLVATGACGLRFFGDTRRCGDIPGPQAGFFGLFPQRLTDFTRLIRAAGLAGWLTNKRTVRLSPEFKGKSCALLLFHAPRLLQSLIR